MPKITNTTQSQLVPPDGPTIPAGGNRLISSDEWAKKESNAVVKAWIAAGALVVEPAEGDSETVDTDGDAGEGLQQGNANEGDGAGEKLTEAQLGDMSNDALKQFIESKGGTVKSTWNKAELIAQAVEIQK
ncbi:hypothetical protein EVC02_028 [Rhizobium phage RHph_N17]|nr:hypothetical protein EVC02_028 [Rhizobium phage RHph_N17]